MIDLVHKLSGILVGEISPDGAWPRHVETL